MLTQAQRNAVFTNIGTAYTVDGNAYTAVKTYREHWDGSIDTPIIALQYVSQTVIEQDAVGRSAEWDTDLLSIDICALTDHTNGVHGGRIVNDIARELVLWFKQDADAAWIDNGVKVKHTGAIKPLSDLDERIYRRQFDVTLLYKLI